MTLEPLEPEEAVELYLQDRKSELAKSTQYAHSSRLGHFVRWCNEQGIDNLNELTGRKLHRYRLWRRADGNLAPPTEKSQMDTLRVFIRWCGTIDAVPTDLWSKVVSPSLSEGENSRDVMVDSEVAKGILEYLSTYEYASERHVTFHLMWHALLRRGAVRALDLEDYDSEEMSLDVRHRPETETPIKNKHNGERFIALSSETCTVLDAWIEDRRPDSVDEYGRNPMLSTSQGRAHLTTIQSYIYSITRPCTYDKDCPHDREISECKAAAMRSSASTCPSSLSPHAVRRGAITHWLNSDVPEQVVSARANVSPAVLDEHYDRRTEREKMEQRRRYLDNV
ncbi:tyrosine-type recombinase/integrase [Halopelagius longus]|uniref:Site-specific integrase n=2 Tax=Halopelagius longus TaxID=1236180 RepID=A0A1H0XNP2_9EURY|nr:site-specific integrase [Halopelagius longus]RDI71969.1 site-specific integrase [Halopelagius longus]SDQ04530.1 Site-specific recombinase XerD [Halopelagius longus]